MIIHEISDIHIEFQDLILPGGELLIIAGDMAEARSFFRNDSGGMRLQAKRLWRFIQEELPKYNKVLFVPGNHEYYGKTIGDAEKLLGMILPNNTIMLQNDWVCREGINFYGTTLWTDLNKEDPETMFQVRFSMTDYKMIDAFLPYNQVDLHKKMKGKLVEFLNSHKNERTVIITHHAPCALSIHEKYKDARLMNGAFYSEQSDVILDNPQISHWFHGHMHDGVRYFLDKTEVICHPRGYYGYEPQAKNYQPLEIEI